MVSSASNPIDLHIGQRTQLARVLAGIELEELATALCISPQQMRAYELGERMSASTLFLIAKIVRKPISYFFDSLFLGG